MSSYVWPPEGGGSSGVTSLNTLIGDIILAAGSGISLTPSGKTITIANTEAGGSVTSVSVVSANGLAGTVANATTTPAITLSTSITGLLKGNGTAISAATAGTDYVIPSGSITGSAGSFTGSLAGDVTGTQGATVLATVNSNTGSFGSSTSIPSFTVNGKGLITAASGNAVVAPAGTLSGTILNSTVTGSSLTSLGTQAQALNMGTNQIINVVDPTTAQMAATKNYVDTVASGLQPIQACYAGTIGSNLPGTYTSVAAGIGDTFQLTATSTFTIDGTTPPVGSRILIKDQSSGYQNGVYTLTTNGNGVVGALFTRAFDFDTPSDMNAGNPIPIINGTVNAPSGNPTLWIQTATVTSIGSSGTALVFVKFNSGGSGTVTSVTFTGDGTVLSSTPSSAVTTSGTLTASLLSQSANKFLAAPSGSSGAPTFRSIVGADLPLITTGSTVVSKSSAYNVPSTGYVVIMSGASWSVTLPDATVYTTGSIVLQHNGSGLNQAYTILTTSSQTINPGAIASGGYVLSTVGETLTLISNGSNWTIQDHVTNTDWITDTTSNVGIYAFTISSGTYSGTLGATYTNNSNTYTLAETFTTSATTIYLIGPPAPTSTGTLTNTGGTHSGNPVYTAVSGSPVNPTATTTSPVFYGSPTTNQTYWRRTGRFMELWINFYQSVAGTSAGSGDYIWAMPTGASIDTTYATTYTGGSAQTDVAETYVGVTNFWPASGRASYSAGYVTFTCCAAYTSGSFRIYGLYNLGTSSVISVGSGVCAATNVVAYNFRVSFPILGWKP